MAYDYDVFLSYPVDSLAGKWVSNHFLPVLKEEVEAQDPTVKIFCWTENEIGVIWDNKLKQAHSRSKIMVAVLTPPYFFKSQWCPTEWETMRKREEILRLGLNLDGTDSLIFPVLFSDGDNLPDEARRITAFDFRKWAFPDIVFQTTPEYLVFRQRVREFALALINRLTIAPAWSDKWPVISAPPLSAPRAKKPTLDVQSDL